MELFWDKNDNDDINGYNLYYSNKLPVGYNSNSYALGDTNSYGIRNLEPGYVYYMGITATNNIELEGENVGYCSGKLYKYWLKTILQ